MINMSKMEQVKRLVESRDEQNSYRDEVRRPVQGIKGMNEEQLRQLRSEIDTLLPKKKLNDMDLEEELVDQYRTIQLLQASTLVDMDATASQRAQVANSVTSALGQLVKLQVDVGRDERLKKIENILLKAIESLPQKAKDDFFEKYEALANEAGVSE